MPNHNNNQSGFALLMALIVVSVVISVGLSLLDLTIKQLRLSTGAKDSESAFHAANAGVECLRYWRLASAADFESGNGASVPMSCFGVSGTIVKDPRSVFAGPYIFKYDVKFDWASNRNRCSEITFITMSTDPTYSPPGITLYDVPSYISGYPYDPDKICVPGGKCTIASVRGYNQPCSAIGKVGVVQREVLLEL